MAERAKQYIDFAAENGFGGVLTEGWYTGWDAEYWEVADAYDFTEPTPDYDLEEVARYAKEKGVGIIVHNETSGGIANYVEQMDEAYELYQSLGFVGIKPGYVADQVGGGHSHYSQWAVNHHRYMIEKAAQHQLLRTAAIELRRSRPDAVCVALHPGTVATPLSARSPGRSAFSR